MAKLVKIITIIAVTIPYAVPLSIEHPHSYSVFKRGVVLGDLSYSYASTDMGSSDGGRVKTVTVIKNVSVPRPTSTMFSDRTEQFFETIDLSGHKTKEHVQYWPPDSTNKMKKITLKPPTFNIPDTKESPQKDFKHPIELLEIAKSAAKTQSQLLRNQNLAAGDTGPVVFPPDAQMVKKKNNGVISVAKEYTSVLTTTPKERNKTKTVSKLSTKVETQKPKQKQPDVSFNSFDASSLFQQDDFEQSEYVYSPETNTYALKQISKAPAELKDKIRNTQYAFKDPSPPNTIKFKLYPDPANETSPDLLYSELANAVATRNISMIKSLAEQLDEPYEFPKFDFESLKMSNEYVPLSFDVGSSFKTSVPAEPEATTMEMATKMDISDDSTTTVEGSTTTKKPAKYIAPRLRGIMRFSSRKP